MTSPNTISFARIFLFAGLGACVLGLPACGGNKVRSDSASQEVLRSSFDSSTFSVEPAGESQASTQEEKTLNPYEEETFQPQKNVRKKPKKIVVERLAPSPVVVAEKREPTPVVPAAGFSSDAGGPSAGAGEGEVEIPQTAVEETPLPEAPASRSSGSSWLWWLLLILACACGYYLWKKRKEKNTAVFPGGAPAPQPAPPLGGLSPVSGYLQGRRLLPPEPKRSILRRLWDAL